MYTVFRFFFADDETTDTGILLDLGRKANEIRPGFFDGLHRGEGGFSGSVADSNEWGDHVEAMIDFLVTMSPVIRLAYEKTVRTEFDIAVDNYDRPEVAVSSYQLPQDLILKLGQLGVEFMFSVYWSPGATSESNSALDEDDDHHMGSETIR